MILITEISTVNIRNARYYYYVNTLSLLSLYDTLKDSQWSNCGNDLSSRMCD